MARVVSGLYFGDVMHRRLRPFGHKFRYRIFSMLIDLDEVDALAGRLRLFSRNAFNLFSFHDRDHGVKDGTSPRAWAEQQIRAAGVETIGMSYRILCFPRILGYVFNPLSVWFCMDSKGALAAVIYEVRNTFGESVSYVLPYAGKAGAGEVVRQSCAKDFHVSPFMRVEGAYDFRVRVPSERYDIAIRYGAHDGELLFAAQRGTFRPLTDGNLTLAFFAFPLMTLKVIGAIHFEALRLWLKGARYTPKPAPPARSVIISGSPGLQAAE